MKATGYTICAYLDDNTTDNPVATGSGGFQATPPAGSISITWAAGATAGAPVTITASGSSQITQTLYAYLETGNATACALTPADEVAYGGGALDGGHAVGPGTYSRQYSFTPAVSGGYTICAYLDDNTQDSPAAAAGGSSNVCVIGATLAVNSPPPVAAFTAPPVLLAFQGNVLNGSASVGCNLSYAWNFGDGSFAFVADPTFVPSGIYDYPIASPSRTRSAGPVQSNTI